MKSAAVSEGSGVWVHDRWGRGHSPFSEGREKVCMAKGSAGVEAGQYCAG